MSTEDAVSHGIKRSAGVVTSAVATQEEADREVARLNEIETHGRRGPGRFYFAQYTRRFIEPEYLATLPS